MLIGGTWLVLGGTLKINELQTQDFFGNPLSTVVENDAANVTLSGAGTQFNALNNLATNNGDLGGAQRRDAEHQRVLSKTPAPIRRGRSPVR